MISTVKIFIQNGKITEDISTAVREETKILVDNITNKSLLKGLIKNLFKLDPTLENHITSVCILSTAVGNEFVGNDCLLELAEGAIYHDIGKLKVPHEILNKTSKLSEEEYQLIKSHPEDGFQELELYIKKGVSIYPTSSLVALEHHEKYDGTGYPFGKKGEKENVQDGIHLYSRIVAIADVCSALLMKRCYKEPMTIQEAIEILDRCSFDPTIYKAFRQVLLRSI